MSALRAGSGAVKDMRGARVPRLGLTTPAPPSQGQERLPVKHSGRPTRRLLVRPSPACLTLGH